MVNQTETREPALTAEEFSKHFMSMADKSADEFIRKTVIDFIRKYKTSSATEDLLKIATPAIAPSLTKLIKACIT